MISPGGFVAPTAPGLTVAQAGARFRRFIDSMPVFNAVRGHIDFRPPEVLWAERRERELRASARMWDWPHPPTGR